VFWRQIGKIDFLWGRLVSRIELYNTVEVTFNRFCITFNIGAPTIRKGSQRRRGRSHVLTKQGLIKVKTRALRKGVWFKALSRIERSIVDLTIRCVEIIRSHKLAETVSGIINKILEALGSNFLKTVERIGTEIVEGICQIAEEWGNEDSSAWKYEVGFVRFLGMNAISTNWVNM